MRQRRKPRAAQLGITDADYQALLASQGGGCAICDHPPRTRRLHVDHDHKTGKVRGLLCHRCNRALPSWISLAWLRSAIDYLERTTT
jgi:Recombination endonuclease VII